MATNAFVWFHNNSDDTKSAIRFYEELFGWKAADGPPGMTMFAAGANPIAGIGDKDGKISGWVPYAQVDDVDAATKRAVKLGAEVIKAKTRGPAGEYSIVRDPGGRSRSPR